MPSVGLRSKKKECVRLKEGATVHIAIGLGILNSTLQPPVVKDKERVKEVKRTRLLQQVTCLRAHLTCKLHYYVSEKARNYFLSLPVT